MLDESANPVMVKELLDKLHPAKGNAVEVMKQLFNEYKTGNEVANVP